MIWQRESCTAVASTTKRFLVGRCVGLLLSPRVPATIFLGHGAEFPIIAGIAVSPDPVFPPMPLPPPAVSPPLIWNPDGDAHTETLAAELGLSVVAEPPESTDSLLVFFNEGRLVVGRHPSHREHPICVDFAEQYRLRRPGKELLLKAIGGRRAGLTVVDATAGLGRDGFLMASYGAQVSLCERHPVVAALLADGLARGSRAEAEVAEIVSRLRLSAISALEMLTTATPDVIYLDPMFPESKKSALVKKEMRLFHSLVGSDEDTEALLALALQRAKHRVVVKRPPHAPPIAGPLPQFAVSGKAVRFDIYPLRAFPT